MRTVDIEHLKTRLSYDPHSGLLSWLPRSRSEFKSDRAYLAWVGRYENREGFTALNANGYKIGRVGQTNILAHRVAWALHYGVWPDGEIDHINGNRTDNRICNLRVVSTSENARNRRIDNRNRTGVSGVYWHKEAGKWCAAIGKREKLGYFSNFDDAVKARKAAEARQGYHPNHGRAA